VIGRPHHIDDERLFECYVSERSGEPVEPRLAEHLTDCLECAQRFGALAEFMGGLKADADAEIDAIFTPERLQRQREHIGQRLEQVGRVAQIISFPGRLVARHVAARTPRVGPRWTAAAAAAGLFVGVGLGIVVDQQRTLRFAPAATAARTAAPVQPAAPAPGPAPTDVVARPVENDYETFVVELEQLRGGPRAPELRLLDAMTPHVHPTALQVH
jgi:hypothetical protein